MSSVVVRPINADDPARIEELQKRIGWVKPPGLYQKYLDEHSRGERHVLIAEVDGEFAGYVTVVRQSGYPPFRQQSIPEIIDFNVLVKFRRRGIGTRLMDTAEAYVAERTNVIGIGVGMHEHYGPAQRLYVKRGYVPDGLGVAYEDAIAPMGAVVKNDDSLVLHFTKALKRS
ncbi:MAG TPA: GNAT family N-acetyltransferase [Planctomycetota bacterium]|nr:GNAT family N-acetyltransferase [Planctomycetota bacterium]